MKVRTHLEFVMISQEEKNFDLLEWAGYSKTSGFEVNWWLRTSTGKLLIPSSEVPNFFTNRNAIWELEEKMSDKQKQDYMNEIFLLISDTPLNTNSPFWNARHAPTEILAEAAWKTIKNLDIWRENEAHHRD